MTDRIQALCSVAAVWANLGFASLAHAAAVTTQRTTLSCTAISQGAPQQSQMTRHHASRQHTDATAGKKVRPHRVRAATAPVDYEHDLGRHQAAS